MAEGQAKLSLCIYVCYVFEIAVIEERLVTQRDSYRKK